MRERRRDFNFQCFPAGSFTSHKLSTRRIARTSAVFAAVAIAFAASIDCDSEPAATNSSCESSCSCHLPTFLLRQLFDERYVSGAAMQAREQQIAVGGWGRTGRIGA